MANNQRRKPHIRKTAPTVRERAETAQAKAAEEKPQRLRKSLAKLPKPKKRLNLSNNKLVAKLAVIFRPLGKVLSKLAPRYFINAWRELKLVSWPSAGETRRLTLAVFIFALVFGAIVAVVDKGLDVLFKNVVLK